MGALVTGEVELTNSKNLAVRRHKDYAGVVLWLEPVDRPVPAMPPKHVEMLQKDKGECWLWFAADEPRPPGQTVTK